MQLDRAAARHVRIAFALQALEGVVLFLNILKNIVEIQKSCVLQVLEGVTP